MLKFFRGLKFKLLALVVSIASSFQIVAFAKVDVKIKSEPICVSGEKGKVENAKSENNIVLTLQYDNNENANNRMLAAYTILNGLKYEYESLYKGSANDIISYSFDKNNKEGSKFVIKFKDSELVFLHSFFSMLNKIFCNGEFVNKNYLYNAITSEGSEFEDIYKNFHNNEKYGEGYKNWFKSFLREGVYVSRFINNSSVYTLEKMLNKILNANTEFPKISGAKESPIKNLWNALWMVTSSEKKKADGFRYNLNEFEKKNLFSNESGTESLGEGDTKLLGKKTSTPEAKNLNNKIESSNRKDPYVLIADVLKEIVSIEVLDSIVTERRALFESKDPQEQGKDFVEEAKKTFEENGKNQNNI